MGIVQRPFESDIFGKILRKYKYQLK